LSNTRSGAGRLGRRLLGLAATAGAWLYDRTLGRKYRDIGPFHVPGQEPRCAMISVSAPGAGDAEGLPAGAALRLNARVLESVIDLVLQGEGAHPTSLLRWVRRPDPAGAQGAVGAGPPASIGSWSPLFDSGDGTNDRFVPETSLEWAFETVAIQAEVLDVDRDGDLRWTGVVRGGDVEGATVQTVRVSRRRLAHWYATLLTRAAGRDLRRRFGYLARLDPVRATELLEKDGSAWLLGVLTTADIAPLLSASEAEVRLGALRVLGRFGAAKAPPENAPPEASPDSAAP
jgi:hypothetical protein